MTVPDGFKVELVAAEPDIVNPVAMTFDERGRIWITESLEYPRSSPGEGRDRVKVLADSDGDGRVDQVTVFAEGLNIPSGIAVGYGGVWVANAPDLLFLEDTDGDGRADRRKVIVTGFGRTDTHELPNSLTWGPDGWLYGLNGVFNHSHVRHQGREHRFTCTLFRVHPRTHQFELFAEGTSNPWGIAWNPEGAAFVSACVIDHLWHLTETGYYIRQGGPYPPFTWKIGSIVDHQHQMAAYCGLHYFDSDAYPEPFRDRLYMGNIHGGCINVDRLERDGSTYRGLPEPDFLTANDVWFMPVAQQTGPDGCLYILDWYDRYHCYQDARHDPEGIDRLKGRLYRVRYGDSPRAAAFDLARETDDALVDCLSSRNVYFRATAQRLLQQRATVAARPQLERLVLDDAAPKKTRMHALFALVGGGPLDAKFHARLLAHPDASLRAWAVRAAGSQRSVEPPIREHIAALADDTSPDVQLQVAIAARKLDGVDPLPLLMRVLAASGDDKLIPHIVWQNLHPLLEAECHEFIRLARNVDHQHSLGLARMMPHAIDRIVARGGGDPGPIAALFETLTVGPYPNEEGARLLLSTLAQRTRSGEIRPMHLAELRRRLAAKLSAMLSGRLRTEAALLAATWDDADGRQIARDVLVSERHPHERRIAALEALVFASDAEWLEDVDRLLADRKGPPAFRAAVLAAMTSSSDSGVADVTLRHYSELEPELKPLAIELLTSRPAWSKALLASIGDKHIPAGALNVNQVRKLLESRDDELVRAVSETWGTVRTDRNPQREEVVVRMREFLRTNHGDPHAGLVVFKKVCGQCHKLYGEGQEVGPEITASGRASFDQLLSNVFDPSLVIGPSYQARTVLTADGRVLTGLVSEESEDRIVLKLAGGKLETIARADVEEIRVSQLSMMPEGLENQLQPQELSDLFALLTLDRPPSDPAAKPIPGTP